MVKQWRNRRTKNTESKRKAANDQAAAAKKEAKAAKKAADDKAAAAAQKKATAATKAAEEAERARKAKPDKSDSKEQDWSDQKKPKKEPPSGSVNDLAMKTAGLLRKFYGPKEEFDLHFTTILENIDELSPLANQTLRRAFAELIDKLVRADQMLAEPKAQTPQLRAAE
jgi:hypothetical protein